MVNRAPAGKARPCSGHRCRLLSERICYVRHRLLRVVTTVLPLFVRSHGHGYSPPHPFRATMLLLRTLCQRKSRIRVIRVRSALIVPSTKLTLAFSSGGDARRWGSMTDRRALTTRAPQTSINGLHIEEYDSLSEATMTRLLERLEDLLDELGNNDAEVDYHSGVLTLKLGPHGTYVINKQPPNKQIWLSSPISGPKRYDYVRGTDDWRYARDGEELGALLERELSETLGRDVRLGLARVSDLA